MLPACRRYYRNLVSHGSTFLKGEIGSKSANEDYSLTSLHDLG